MAQSRSLCISGLGDLACTALGIWPVRPWGSGLYGLGDMPRSTRSRPIRAGRSLRATGIGRICHDPATSIRRICPDPPDLDNVSRTVFAGNRTPNVIEKRARFLISNLSALQFQPFQPIYCDPGAIQAIQARSVTVGGGGLRSEIHAVKPDKALR